MAIRDMALIHVPYTSAFVPVSRTYCRQILCSIILSLAQPARSFNTFFCNQHSVALSIFHPELLLRPGQKGDLQIPFRLFSTLSYLQPVSPPAPSHHIVPRPYLLLHIHKTLLHSLPRTYLLPRIPPPDYSEFPQ